MTVEPDDDAPNRRRSRRGRLERIRPSPTGRPWFCVEMLDAALMDSKHSHRVVVGANGSDGTPDEWIELDVPTELYANPQGKRLLAVTIRVEDGVVRIIAPDVYTPGSLRSSPYTFGRTESWRQLLWLAHPQSRLEVELLVDPARRIEARLSLENIRAFNRADVPRFVGSFASAIDLVEQTIRDTGLRKDSSEM
jgi:hypothetical protein